MIRSLYIILFAFLLQPVNSQIAFQAILDSVEANNKTLAADYHYFEAQRIGAKTGIYLDNPSVSFDRLSNVSGNYSEMVISQSFDFPTAYMYKNKIANLTASQLEERYRQNKVELFASTVQVYAGLIFANRKLSLLEKRQHKALQLQEGIEKRLNAGDANIFEINRVRSELARSQSELQLAESHRQILLRELATLNGGKSIAVNDTVYPVLTEFVLTDTSVAALSLRYPLLKQGQAEVSISDQHIRLQRALSLPAFEFGYRQDRNSGQTYNGFHAGISVPLFENKNKVRVARSNQLYAKEAVQAYQLEIQNSISQIIAEYKAAQQSLAGITDVFNSLNTPDLLLKAYSAGQISYSEFFTEYQNYHETTMYLEELKHKTASLQFQLYILSNI